MTIFKEEGFEDGPPLGAEWKTSGNRPVVTTEEARTGTYCMKSELNENTVDDDRRTETQTTEIPGFGNFDNDTEYWINISIMLHTDFNTSPSCCGNEDDQCVLWQWHYFAEGSGPDQQPFVLRFDTNRDVIVQSETVGATLATVDPDIGNWVDWWMHMKISNTDGFFDVYRNGVQVADWGPGDNHQADKVSGTYMKFGQYAFQYRDFEPLPTGETRIVYHDVIRIADEALPVSPFPDASSDVPRLYQDKRGKRWDPKLRM